MTGVGDSPESVNRQPYEGTVRGREREKLRETGKFQI